MAEIKPAGDVLCGVGENGDHLRVRETAAGFHKDQNCDYTGGMVPFARTKAQRTASGDPRLSLEERYHDHAGYVQAVTDAANHAVDMGFLLPADRDALIQQAQASDVLNPSPAFECSCWNRPRLENPWPMAR